MGSESFAEQIVQDLKNSFEPDAEGFAIASGVLGFIGARLDSLQRECRVDELSMELKQALRMMLKQTEIEIERSKHYTLLQKARMKAALARFSDLN